MVTTGTARRELATLGYIQFQADRHARALRALAIPPGSHGPACIQRVDPWPSPERAGGRIQTCPCCGLTEAAGDFCTRCLARTGPGDWYTRERTEAQRAHTAALLGRKRGVGAPAGPADTSEPDRGSATPSRPS